MRPRHSGVGERLCAEELNIFARDVTWIGGAVPSYSITLGIDATDTSATIGLWQLSCLIIPEGNAHFLLDPSDLVTPPRNYLFGEDSLGISWSNASSPSITFFDFTMDPVEVTGNDKNLLQIEVASGGATGSFELAIVPYDANNPNGSYWQSDLFSDYQAFDVVSPLVPGSNVVASLVFPAVPEPSIIYMLSSGLILFLIRLVRQKIWSEAKGFSAGR